MHVLTFMIETVSHLLQLRFFYHSDGYGKNESCDIPKQVESSSSYIALLLSGMESASLLGWKILNGRHGYEEGNSKGDEVLVNTKKWMNLCIAQATERARSSCEWSYTPKESQNHFLNS